MSEPETVTLAELIERPELADAADWLIDPETWTARRFTPPERLWIEAGLTPAEARSVLRLRGVEPVGRQGDGQWVALCPAHDDGSPSLTFAVKDGKGLVFDCKSGCDFRAVRRALAPNAGEADRLLTLRGVDRETRVRFGIRADHEAGGWTFPVPVGGPPSRIKYFDPWRAESKTRWWPRKPDGADVYNLEDCRGLDEAWLLEGEPDVWVAARAGLPAMSLTGGATAFPRGARDALRASGVRRVRVVYDNDDAGLEGGRKAVRTLREIGVEATLHLLPEDLGPGGDVTDLFWRLDAHAHPERLADALRALPEVNADEEDEPRALPLVMTLAELDEHPDMLEPPEELSPWLAWRGDYTLVAGREKSGKSTLITTDATEAARAGRRVLWASAEESANIIAERFRRAQAPRSTIHFFPVWPRGWEELERAIDMCRPEVLYVDSFSSIVARFGEAPEGYPGEKWQALSGLFKGLAVDHGIAVVVLHHSPKSADSGGDPVRGSTGIGAAADTIIHFAPGRAVSERRLDRSRSRWGLPSLVLRFDGLTYREVERQDDEPTLELRVYQYIYDDPGCGAKDIERGTGAKAADVRAARDSLAGRSPPAIENRGEGTQHEWHPTEAHDRNLVRLSDDF